VTVQNLLDRRYVGSVVVNAAGGRFYEPAPERTLSVGVSLTTGR
jgi:iron complex outermembrane receptor protein